MAKHSKRTAPTAEYKKVIIRLYGHRNRFKATFQIPGHKRYEFYGKTQAAAQKAAQTAIDNHRDPKVFVAQRDEDAARDILDKHGISLAEAARLWEVNHSNKPQSEITVEALREKWLTEGIRERSYHNVRSLRTRTQPFEDEFGSRKFSSITLQEINIWLLRLANLEKAPGKKRYGGRSVRNIYDATKIMFRFSRDAGFLESDRLSPMEISKRPKADPPKKHIYTPEVMQQFLDAAWGMASPGAVAMAITAFTAIRTEELCSPDPKATAEIVLHWEDFRWKEKFIYIREEVDKNGVARDVPMPPVLMKLLQPFKGKGKVYPDKRLDLHYSAIAAKAGLKWKTNAPRHSAITYAMLLSDSPAEVANRSGNSVQTIESNYRNRGATKSQALAWFKLKPKVKWGSNPKSNEDKNG
jgi:hypothetical protein